MVQEVVFKEGLTVEELVNNHKKALNDDLTKLMGMEGTELKLVGYVFKFLDADEGILMSHGFSSKGVEEFEED